MKTVGRGVVRWGGRAPEQRKPGVAPTVSVGFAVGAAFNLFLSLSVIHHQEALEGAQVLKEWVQI